MKSPFPGMDPYLEKRWRDVHARLVLYCCDQIEESLPKSLVARVEERIVFESDDQEQHRYPDLRVVETAPRTTRGDGPATAVAEGAEPGSYLVSIATEPMTENYIEIVEVDSGRRVVTVLEFLSMTNKTRGEGLDHYLEKQVEYRRGKVSLVEIDLLRAGRRQLVMPVRHFPKKARTTYQACVRRGWQADMIEVFAMPLQLPLPKIKIPLREQEQEMLLDLQPLLEHAYRKGRYFDTIDYRQPAEPPLEGAEAAWANELLRAAGKR